MLPDRNFFAPYKIRYTWKSITAAHICLDIATAPAKSNELIQTESSSSSSSTSSTNLLRRCGCFLHARIFYALRLLLSVAHEVWRTKNYKTLDVNSLKIDASITALRARLRAASEKGRYRVPTLWLNALQAKIEPWWQALRGLLAQDGLSLTVASENGSPTSSPTPVSPLQRADGAFSVDCQQPATADFFSTSTSSDVPLSPFLVESSCEMYTFDPFPAYLSNNMIPFTDLLEPATTDFEAGLPSSTAPQQTHANVQLGGPGFNPLDKSVGNDGTIADESQPLPFDFGSLGESLPESEFNFSPLPPYVLGDQVPDVVEAKE